MNLQFLNALKLTGKKQWELSQQTKISESRISKILNRRGKPPTLVEKELISEALGFPIQNIFQNEGSEGGQNE